MKKKRVILICVIAAMALALALVAVGCGGSGGDEDKTTTTETTTTETTTTAAPKDNDILKGQLQSMIDEYGRGTSNGSGVAFAKILDMDGDGKREMIVVHDMKAEIFAIKDNKATSIFEGNVGIQYGQTDTGYEVLINESIDPPTLVIFNSSSEWSDENITAVTVSGGAAVPKNLRASTTGENDTPSREELVSFSIDGATVSASDYNAEYTRLTEGADSVSPMTPADLDEIMASM